VLAQAIALDGARVEKKKPKGKSQAQIVAQRKRSAKILAAFDPETPRPAKGNAQALTPFFNHGYLRKTRAGILRTAKEYVVNPFAKSADAK